jgi:hypothetical protein
MRTIKEIAEEIFHDWKKVNFAAEPYLLAMLGLENINDKYGEDSAKEIILYFLSNASTWRGTVAKRIKQELKELCNANRV